MSENTYKLLSKVISKFRSHLMKFAIKRIPTVYTDPSKKYINQKNLTQRNLNEIENIILDEIDKRKALRRLKHLTRRLKTLIHVY